MREQHSMTIKPLRSSSEVGMLFSVPRAVGMSRKQTKP
jgi:hypothetical protein